MFANADENICYILIRFVSNLYVSTQCNLNGNTIYFCSFEIHLFPIVYLHNEIYLTLGGIRAKMAEQISPAVMNTKNLLVKL